MLYTGKNVQMHVDAAIQQVLTASIYIVMKQLSEDHGFTPEQLDEFVRKHNEELRKELQMKYRANKHKR